MAVVLIGFLVIGLALPVLPLHVHQGLGLGTFVVGLVTGSQFAASLVSRVWSGHFADSRGAKRAVVIGLLAAAASGVLYLLSLLFVGAPGASVTVLLLGRALLGAAESFIITGAVSWGLALVDPGSTGKVIAWVGTAMFATMALGAPVGSTLYAHYGFASIAMATTLLPLATLLFVAPLEPRRTAASRPAGAHPGARHRLGAGPRRGIRQCRLRRDHRLRLAAVRGTRLEPGLARLQRLRGIADRHPRGLRPPA
jgi:MFS family permease